MLIKVSPDTGYDFHFGQDSAASVPIECPPSIFVLPTLGGVVTVVGAASGE